MQCKTSLDVKQGCTIADKLQITIDFKSFLNRFYSADAG